MSTTRALKLEGFPGQLVVAALAFLDPIGRILCAQLRLRLGPGEASWIALAHYDDHQVMDHDRVARRLARQRRYRIWHIRTACARSRQGVSFTQRSGSPTPTDDNRRLPVADIQPTGSRSSLISTIKKRIHEHTHVRTGRARWRSTPGTFARRQPLPRNAELLCRDRSCPSDMGNREDHRAHGACGLDRELPFLREADDAAPFTASHRSASGGADVHTVLAPHGPS